MSVVTYRPGGSGGSGSGNIGQSLNQFTGPTAVTSASFATVVTKTLTDGKWLVGGYVTTDNAPGYAGFDAKLVLKGVDPGFGEKNYLIQQVPAGTAATVTFSSQVVVISPEDLNKTVLIQSKARGATSDTYAYIEAVWLAN